MLIEDKRCGLRILVICLILLACLLALTYDVDRPIPGTTQVPSASWTISLFNLSWAAEKPQEYPL
jgi:hypothetical protein